MDDLLFRFIIFIRGITIFDLQIYPDGKGLWDCKGFHVHILYFEFGWNDESGWFHKFHIFHQDPYLWIALVFGYKVIFDISLLEYDRDFSSFSFLGYLYLWNEDY